MPKNKFEVLTEIIQNRRSIFPAAFTGESIRDAVVEELLENANWAPSHKKTAPWRFIVFKGEQKIGFGNYLAQEYKNGISRELFSDKKFIKTQQKAERSSHLIAIIMQRDPAESVPEWEEEAAVSCAVMNLWLSVSARGLGGYWSSGKHILNAAEFLGLKEGQKCMGLFYLGVPKGNPPAAYEKKEIHEIVEWREHN